MRCEPDGKTVLLAIRSRTGDRPRPENKIDMDAMLLRPELAQRWRMRRARRTGGLGCRDGVAVPGDNAWRLPTKDELDGIVESDCKKPAINEDVFPDTALMAYWTGTPSGPSYAWHVNFRWGISKRRFDPHATSAALVKVRSMVSDRRSPAR